MVAGDALERRGALLRVVGRRRPRRRAPRIGRRLHRLYTLLVYRAVALDAPAHRQLGPRHRHGRQVHHVVDDVLARRGVHLLHRLDTTVAGLADEPRLDVVLVRELHVLGDLENPEPRDGLLLVPVRVELLHLLVPLRGHDLVATHALLHRGYPGVASAARTRVAILTGDLVGARLDDVGEEDGVPRPLARGRDGQDLGRIVVGLRQ